MPEYPFIPYSIERLPDAEMLRRGRELCVKLRTGEASGSFRPIRCLAN